MALYSAKRHARVRGAWPVNLTYSPSQLAAVYSQLTPTVTATEEYAGEHDWLLVGYADRLYDWAGYCGIPGGIPVRETIYATMTTANSLAEINAAIAACPVGQVVYLSAGTYQLGTGRLGWKAGITVRGAGPGQTIILKSSGSNAVYIDSTVFTEANGVAVASGATKNSMSITLSSAPPANFSIGKLIIITEDQSQDKFDTDIGDYARDGLTSSPPSLSGTRVFRYLSRITAVNGNTIGLASPIPFNFTPALTVTAYAQDGSGMPISLLGFESMTFQGIETPFRTYCLDRCWFKDLEFRDCPGCDSGHIQMHNAFQPEIRRCFVRDVVNYPTHVEGVAFGTMYGTCNGLFVDNISYQTSCQFVGNGPAACVYVHNYAVDCTRGTSAVVMPALQYHGPQGFMNLIEGNIWPGYCADGYHGSASHDTLLRNHINGLHTTRTLDRRLLNLCRGTYYTNVVGNILGDPSWNLTAYESPLGFSHTDSSAYALGFPESGGSTLTPEVPWSTHPGVYPDPAVSSTLLRHGNYDYYNDAIVWDGGITSHAVPNSLFYSSKPAFFGSLNWPPIDPSSPTSENIPAKHRWANYQVSGVLADLFEDEE